MARPRKIGTDEMLKIVDSYFENCGDPSKLKCSLLEEYAVSLGFEIKAYDFRRNEPVRLRMEELRGSADANGVGTIAYKNLDVDALLNRNYTHEMMKTSLLELDETWRHVYEKAVDLSRKNKALLSEVATKNRTIETLSAEKDGLEARIKSLEHNSNDLITENRYLKKALKEYLYPAIANEILKSENVLKQSDTEVKPETMLSFVDADVPSSFSNTVAADMEMLSRGDLLLNRMRGQKKKGKL